MTCKFNGHGVSRRRQDPPHLRGRPAGRLDVHHHPAARPDALVQLAVHVSRSPMDQSDGLAFVIQRDPRGAAAIGTGGGNIGLRRASSPPWRSSSTPGTNGPTVGDQRHGNHVGRRARRRRGRTRPPPPARRSLLFGHRTDVRVGRLRRNRRSRSRSTSSKTAIEARRAAAEGHDRPRLAPRRQRYPSGPPSGIGRIGARALKRSGVRQPGGDEPLARPPLARPLAAAGDDLQRATSWSRRPRPPCRPRPRSRPRSGRGSCPAWPASAARAAGRRGRRGSSAKPASFSRWARSARGRASRSRGGRSRSRCRRARRGRRPSSRRARPRPGRGRRRRCPRPRRRRRRRGRSCAMSASWATASPRSSQPSARARSTDGQEAVGGADGVDLVGALAAGRAPSPRRPAASVADCTRPSPSARTSTWPQAIRRTCVRYLR